MNCKTLSHSLVAVSIFFGWKSPNAMAESLKSRKVVQVDDFAGAQDPRDLGVENFNPGQAVYETKQNHPQPAKMEIHLESQSLAQKDKDRGFQNRGNQVFMIDKPKKDYMAYTYARSYLMAIEAMKQKEQKLVAAKNNPESIEKTNGKGVTKFKRMTGTTLASTKVVPSSVAGPTPSRAPASVGEVVPMTPKNIVAARERATGLRRNR